MPKATTNLTLILNEKEVEWLKSLMQNPFNTLSFDDDESEEDKKMRRAFWDALGG